MTARAVGLGLYGIRFVAEIVGARLQDNSVARTARVGSVAVTDHHHGRGQRPVWIVRHTAVAGLAGRPLVTPACTASIADLRPVTGVVLVNRHRIEVDRSGTFEVADLHAILPHLCGCEPKRMPPHVMADNAFCLVHLARRRHRNSEINTAHGRPAWTVAGQTVGVGIGRSNRSARPDSKERKQKRNHAD